MSSVTITLLGQPVPSAQGNRGKNGYRFVPKRQSDAVARIAAVASEEMAGREMLTGPLCISFRAEVPIPTSFSKAKQAEAALRLIWPIKRPDLKNLAALAEDALKSIVYADDSLVCQHHSEKVYGTRPKITIEVKQIGAPPCEA